MAGTGVRKVKNETRTVASARRIDRLLLSRKPHLIAFAIFGLFLLGACTTDDESGEYSRHLRQCRIRLLA